MHVKITLKIQHIFDLLQKFKATKYTLIYTILFEYKRLFQYTILSVQNLNNNISYLQMYRLSCLI